MGFNSYELKHYSVQFRKSKLNLDQSNPIVCEFFEIRRNKT